MQTNRDERRSRDWRRLCECKFHEYFSGAGDTVRLYIYILYIMWDYIFTFLAVDGLGITRLCAQGTTDGAETLRNAQEQQKKKSSKSILLVITWLLKVIEQVMGYITGKKGIKEKTYCLDKCWWKKEWKEVIQPIHFHHGITLPIAMASIP